jgi:hypothetical protein
VIVNRRKFFKWLGVGTAAVAVAPATLLPKEPVVEQSCSCALRGSWEGECHWCHYNKMECGCIRGHCTCTILDYSDYCKFSSFSIASSIDEMVSDCAVDLSRRAGLAAKEMHNAVQDQI